MELQITVRIPRDLAQGMERAARRLKRSKSEIVRMALRAFLETSPESEGRPLAWIFRPPWPPRGSFRRPRCPRGVWILSVCPIRLRSKRPCVLDGDENVSRGDGAQSFSPSSGQLCFGFGKPFNLGQRLKEAEKSRL